MDIGIKEIIALALQASLFLLVLSLGLESRWSDVAHVLRRPALLIRAVIAVNVIVPAVAVIMCLALPIAPWTRAGLGIMSVSPLAPFAPVKMLKGQAGRDYVIGTYVALMIAAVIVVPLTAVLLAPLTAQSVRIPIPVVVAFIVETVLVPLFIGVAVHRQWPSLGVRVAPTLRNGALAIVVPVALLILLRSAREFVGLIGDGTLAAIVVTVASGLIAGYALGGPDEANRKALGEAAATRHPGLAVVIAELNFDDSRVLAAIVLYLFSSIIFSIACGWALSELKARPLRRAHAPPQ